MIMGEPVPRSESQLNAEYVIYSFLKGTDRRGADPWQHMGAVSDLAQARAKARNLFRSARYSRIELRKKFISEKTGAVMDVPLEVLDHNTDRDVRTITLLLAAAMGCALLALMLSLTL